VVSSWLRPWRSPKLQLVVGGKLAAPPEQLLQRVPDCYGLYLLLAKPPGGRRHLACYLGKAGPAVGEGATPTLRERWAAGGRGRGGRAQARRCVLPRPDPPARRSRPVAAGLLPARQQCFLPASRRPQCHNPSLPPGSTRFASSYLANGDGTFGPAREPRRYLTLLDLQRRGFSLQARCGAGAGGRGAVCLGAGVGAAQGGGRSS
jgi:hypothetical protein